MLVDVGWMLEGGVRGVYPECLSHVYSLLHCCCRVVSCRVCVFASNVYSLLHCCFVSCLCVSVSNAYSLLHICTVVSCVCVFVSHPQVAIDEEAGGANAKHDPADTMMIVMDVHDTAQVLPWRWR